jgi:hypothetical protein
MSVLVWSSVVIAVAAGAPAPGTESAARGGACSWTRVPSPNAGTADNGLSGVAALSATDAWAVGSRVGSSGLFKTLTERWNGASWSVVASPNVGTFNNHLDDVSAVASDDVWAVGAHDGDAGVLIEHWDGSSWRLSRGKDPGTSRNLLLGVAVVAPDDVWAVGYQANDGQPRLTLTEHWNGSSWAVVPSPNRGNGENLLYAVAAVSTHEVWAVGSSDRATGGEDTLVERWNGASWSIVPSPNAATDGSNQLRGITSTGAGALVAVGSSYDGIITRTLIESWNGTAWRLRSSPNPGADFNELWGVADTLSGPRAVGDWRDGFGQPYNPLIIHRNGSMWDVEATPTPGSRPAMLFAIAQVPGGDAVWAVGQLDAGAFRTLIYLGC